MKEKRIAYYGTFGKNQLGHRFRAIKGQFSDEEKNEIEKLDGKIQGFLKKERGFRFFGYDNKYLGLAFPASPDDKRCGSCTIVLVEGATDAKEVLDVINKSDFMKRQFDALCDIYKVTLPK